MKPSLNRRELVPLLILGGAARGLLAIDTREAAPKFHAKTLDGEKLNNESLKGKVVLLQFWATWCGYCKRDQPAVESLLEEFGGKGLVVIAVNVNESKSKVKRYLDQSPRSCKIVLTEDTNLAAIYAATAFPLYVVIDRDGNFAGTQRGAAGEDQLRRLVKKAGLASE